MGRCSNKHVLKPKNPCNIIHDSLKVRANSAEASPEQAAAEGGHGRALGNQTTAWHRHLYLPRELFTCKLSLQPRITTTMADPPVFQRLSSSL